MQRAETMSSLCIMEGFKRVTEMECSGVEAHISCAWKRMSRMLAVHYHWNHADNSYAETA